MKNSELQTPNSKLQTPKSKLAINNRPSAIRNPHSGAPEWLWQTVVWGFGALVIGIGALVIAVAAGVADPKPVGALQWEDHFAEAGAKWETFGSGVSFAWDGLTITLARADEIGGAVMSPPAKEFSFEAAGGQSSGEVGAAYGIVFAYQDQFHYSAVMINGNSYAQVFSADGREWRAWQQWPNILLGYEANRIRIDVVAGEGLIRINDEVLLRAPTAAGGVGVIARASANDQQVRFGWAKLWTK